MNFKFKIFPQSEKCFSIYQYFNLAEVLQKLYKDSRYCKTKISVNNKYVEI